MMNTETKLERELSVSKWVIAEKEKERERERTFHIILYIGWSHGE